MSFGEPNEPIEWDGKFATKPSGPVTPVDEHGRPMLSLGSSSSTNLRREIKERQADNNARRVLIVVLALVPLALGGVSGVLFFGETRPDVMTCIRSAGIAIFLTAMLGGCIFCGAMLQMLRLGGLSPASMVSMFLAPALGFFFLQVFTGEGRESRDPAPAAIIVAIIGTILITPFIAMLSIMLGSSAHWEPSGRLASFVGGIIGALVGIILVRVYCMRFPPRQLAE